jgi:type IV pilus assembly protein PilE
MRADAGFTLLELMIAVVIAAVLAAVAYPSYQSYAGRGYRAEAHTALHRLANLQEQYYLDQRQYAADLTALGEASNPAVTGGARYEVAVAVTAVSFTLTATAQGSQASLDASCPTLTLTGSGVKTPEECWR